MATPDLLLVQYTPLVPPVWANPEFSTNDLQRTGARYRIAADGWLEQNDYPFVRNDEQRGAPVEYTGLLTFFSEHVDPEVEGYYVEYTASLRSGWVEAVTMNVLTEP